jgi:GNAT superfamily N-acetyltransferase
MSVDVRPATAADIEAVCDLLHTNMSARISRERWRLLLDYPWRPVDADRGWVALDGGRIVGFLGLVYADRSIAGRVERFCNICAWYLLKGYRGRGIGQALQAGAVANRDITYTLVTATAATDRAFRRAGLRTLDAERYCFRRRPEPRSDHEVFDGADAIAPYLDSGERRILEDHRRFALRHHLCRADGRSCYLILQVNKKGADVSYHEVMHSSDPEFLAAHAQSIADTLLDRGNSLLAVDKRFLPGTQAREPELLRQPRLYASPRLAPEAIDNLYNEVVLLDLKMP